MSVFMYIDFYRVRCIKTYKSFGSAVKQIKELIVMS